MAKNGSFGAARFLVPLLVSLFILAAGGCISQDEKVVVSTSTPSDSTGEPSESSKKESDKNGIEAPILPKEHASSVVTGPQESRIVTIEVRTGERMIDLVQRLERRGLSSEDAFRRLCRTEEFSYHRFVPEPSTRLTRFEGLFRPGLYSLSFDPNEKSDIEHARKILTLLLEESEKRLPQLSDRSGLSPRDQFILASIVEKEAPAGKDYRKVASVFLNRLRGGSRLAACSAVEYALGYHRPFLTSEDISINSPYNVYLRPGLPPSPICFFSDEALRAVRNPIASRLYYFVYDWTRRELHFARTYDEHLKNADIARTNYIKKYGSDSLRQIYPEKFYEE